MPLPVMRFQTTPPCGERQISGALNAVISQFQSTPPRGERRQGRYPGADLPYFNPRPRVGSDQKQRLAERARLISIHAPVWGATNNEYDVIVIFSISIHAPVWGATANAHKPLASFQCRFDIFCTKESKTSDVLPLFYHNPVRFQGIFRRESPVLFMGASPSHIFPFP